MAWNKPTSGTVDATSSSRPTGRGKMPRLRKGILAGAIVVLGAGLAAWLLSNGEEPSSSLQKKERGRIKEVTPAAVPKLQATDPATTNRPGSYRAPQPKTNGLLPPKLYIPTLEEIEKARLGPDGKPRKKSIYKTPLEQALGTIFSTKLGNTPPRFPSVASLTSDEQINKFFELKFEYDKNASQAVNENRILMQQVRDEMKSFVAEGGKPSEFVNYYYGKLVTANDNWKAAQMMLISMRRDGESPENIAAFHEKASALLKSQGVERELMLPGKLNQAK